MTHTVQTLAEKAVALANQLGRIPSLTKFLQAAAVDGKAVRRVGGWHAVAVEAFGADYEARRKAEGRAARAARVEQTFELEGDALAAFLAHDVFVFTAAQNDTAPVPGFLEALEAYVEDRDGVLGVIPIRYRNPTRASTPSGEDDGLTWDPALRPYLVENDIEITPDLVVLGSIRTQATASNPLCGMAARSKGASAIFGHSKLAMETVATPHDKLPKILYTTGAVTKKNYSTTKAGDLARFHHVHSAIVVERDGERFWIRSISWDGKAFCDLDERWTADGWDGKAKVKALITGDEHSWFMDPTVRALTYDAPGNIVDTLEPEVVVRHDVFDSYSISHHHRHNTITRAVKARAGKGSVERELEDCVAMIDATTRGRFRNKIVESNHNEHLTRWLRGSDSEVEAENLIAFYELKAAVLRSARMGPGGVEHESPFKLWAAERFESDVDFLGRDESYRVGGIELGLHGDEGINGARGSARALSRIGVRTVVGHSHSPCIFEGCWQVGTSSLLRLEYNRRGPSGWLHTHAIIHENNRRQMIHILHGDWRKRA